MRAWRNEPSSLGLKARLITFSCSNNRRAASQIMVYTLGWTRHCSSLLRSCFFFTPRCLTNQSTSLWSTMLYQLMLIRLYRLQKYLYRGNLNTSTCGLSWISLQVHISSSLRGSMTAARSEIRIISNLNTSLRDLNFVCAWCRAGGLCASTITISSLPSSKPNLSSNQLITTNLRPSQNAIMFYIANCYFWREALCVL